MSTQYYLNFSINNTFLLSTSDTGSIHCFAIDEKFVEEKRPSTSFTDIKEETKTPNQTPFWLRLLAPK